MIEPWTLAIETSGPRAGVVLADGAQVLEARDLPNERAYSSELLPLIREMLQAHGRDIRSVGLYCFSAGPGSFTGLRVAATLGRMLHSVVGCRVVAVPTLDVIVENVAPPRPDAIPPQSNVAVLLDAKRGQVYAAAYEFNAPAAEFHCIAPAAVRDPVPWLATIPPPLAVLGSGVAAHRPACEAAGAAFFHESQWRPQARIVAALGMRLAAAGRLCRPEEIVPLYIRPPECEEVYEVRRAAARERRGE